MAVVSLARRSLGIVIALIGWGLISPVQAQTGTLFLSTRPEGATVVVRALPSAVTCDHADLAAQLQGALATALRKAAA